MLKKFDLLILILVVLIVANLAGCSQPPAPETPIKVCVESQSVYGSRGGTWKECTKYKLGCIEPLTLKSENNVLICRLEN